MPELRQPFSLKRFFGRIALLLVNSSGDDIEALGENDGTSRVQLIGWDGAQERVGVETSSELKVSNYGTNSGTATAIKVESSGEQDIVLHGKDSGGTIDSLRTNADKQLQIEVFDELGTKTGKTLGTANPAATTNTNLYTVPASTTTKIATLTACNRSGGAVTIRVGIDVGGGGTNAPGDAEWIYYDSSVPANDTILLDAACGLWLAATDDLVVYATTQNIAFIATGVEYA